MQPRIGPSYSPAPRSRRRFIVVLVLCAIVLAIVVWRSCRLARPRGDETVEVVVPTFEEAIEDQDRLALVCRVLDLPPPPTLANMDKEAAKAIYDAIWNVRGKKLLFDTPKSFHYLGVKEDEIFLVEEEVK